MIHAIPGNLKRSSIDGADAIRRDGGESEDITTRDDIASVAGQLADLTRTV
jgi:hypothetical protein